MLINQDVKKIFFGENGGYHAKYTSNGFYSDGKSLSKLAKNISLHDKIVERFVSCIGVQSLQVVTDNSLEYNLVKLDSTILEQKNGLNSRQLARFYRLLTKELINTRRKRVENRTLVGN